MRPGRSRLLLLALALVGILVVAAGCAFEGQISVSVAAIPLAFGRRLRPQAGTRFAVASLPEISPGGYSLELAFTLAEARAFREKALYAASVSCGRSRYLQPIRPLVTRMARVPAFTIGSSRDATSFSLPHLFGGIRSYGEATRTLSCAR